MRLWQRLLTRLAGRGVGSDDQADRRGAVVLYTREGCHLCTDAKQILVEHLPRGSKLHEVDVDQDESLRAQFGECVPVVEIDGVVRFRGRVNVVLLKRLLKKR